MSRKAPWHSATNVFVGGAMVFGGLSAVFVGGRVDDVPPLVVAGIVLASAGALLLLAILIRRLSAGRRRGGSSG